jgi:hypothetical protein
VGYNIEAITRRDLSCRFRFHGCQRRVVKVVLAVPEFPGGDGRDARAACGSCAAAMQEQRERARKVWER